MTIASNVVGFVDSKRNPKTVHSTTVTTYRSSMCFFFAKTRPARYGQESQGVGNRVYYAKGPNGGRHTGLALFGVEKSWFSKIQTVQLGQWTIDSEGLNPRHLVWIGGLAQSYSFIHPNWCRSLAIHMP